MDVALVVGSLCGAIQTVTYTLSLPRQWKGTIKKAPHHRRIKGLLTDEELERIEDNHNVWDAVAMGMWRTGRYVK